MLVAEAAQARIWRARFLARQAGRACVAPAIHHWPAWLERLAEQVPDAPVPLLRIQERGWWRTIISEDRPQLPPEACAELARQAMEATRLMHAYGVKAHALRGHGEEAEALYRWQRKLRLALPASHGTFPALADAVLAAIPRLNMPPCVLLSGFAFWTPWQKRWLEAMSAHGVQLLMVCPEKRPARMGRYPCADPSAEALQAARLVAELLERDAQGRIAIVLNERADREALAAACEDWLPDTQAVDGMHASLREQPLVQQWLQVLHLAGAKRLRFDDVSSLLLASWVRADEREREARAALELRLRRSNRYMFDYRTLLDAARGLELGALAQGLQAMAAWPRHEKRLPSAWVVDSIALLKQLGVPAHRNAHLVNAFREALFTMAALDQLPDGMDWVSFVARLSELLAETPFALPSTHGQVHVLDANSAMGLAFDHVLALGIDEQGMPGPARPHPLLPVPLQRAHQMPGASAQLALAQAERQWNELRHTCGTLYAFHALQQEGVFVAPSPWIADLSAEHVPDEHTRAPWPLTSWPDAPLVPLRQSHPRGGSSLLQDQAACPFRAFAYHRLGLKPLDTPQPGLRASEKGQLLHAALEGFWRQVESWHALCALSTQALAQRIDEAIDEAWRQCRIYVPRHVRRVETERLRALLRGWLAEERQRPPFTVTRTEWRTTLRPGGDAPLALALELKIDRLDVDAEGRRILIDYKTSRVQASQLWRQGRMREVQLPQYALAAALGVRDAVCFAQVRSGEMRFQGVGGEELGIKGIMVCDGKAKRPEDWAQTLATWRMQLDELAAEFIAGRTDVAPRDPDACRYCGLAAVCRIAERGDGA